MTWTEWKNEVERRMKKQKIDPDTVKIFYIDVHCPWGVNDLDMTVDPEHGLKVTS